MVFSSVCGRMWKSTRNAQESPYPIVYYDHFSNPLVPNCEHLSDFSQKYPATLPSKRQTSTQNPHVFITYTKNSPKPQGSKLFYNQTIIQMSPSRSLPHSLPSTYLWQTPCLLQVYSYPTAPDQRPFLPPRDLFALISGFWQDLM